MKAETVKKENTTIVVTEHSKFNGGMSTDLVSSVDMAEVVNSLFSPAFVDYHGCNVRINNGNAMNPAAVQHLPYGAIYVELFFKMKGSSNRGIKNLSLHGQINKEDNGNVKKGGISAAAFFAVNAANNGASNGRVYDVSAETYEALEEFMMQRNVRWNDHTQEISNNMSIIGSKEEPLVCISGLSLDKILGKIYGTKTDEGEFEYAATPSTPIPGRNEFIIQVCRLDMKTVRKLQRDLGIGQSMVPGFHVSH